MTTVASGMHSDTPGDAVRMFAEEHRGKPVALPEFVDAVAEHAGTTAQVAKRAIFRYMDEGSAHFDADFMVTFVND